MNSAAGLLYLQLLFHLLPAVQPLPFLLLPALPQPVLLLPFLLLPALQPAAEPLAGLPAELPSQMLPFQPA